MYNFGATPRAGGGGSYATLPPPPILKLFLAGSARKRKKIMAGGGGFPGNPKKTPGYATDYHGVGGKRDGVGIVMCEQLEYRLLQSKENAIY